MERVAKIYCRVEKLIISVYHLLFKANLYYSVNINACSKSTVIKESLDTATAGSYRSQCYNAGPPAPLPHLHKITRVRTSQSLSPSTYLSPHEACRSHRTPAVRFQSTSWPSPVTDIPTHRAAALKPRSLLSSDLFVPRFPSDLRSIHVEGGTGTDQGGINEGHRGLAGGGRERAINSHEELDASNEKLAEAIRPPRLGLRRRRRRCEAHVHVAESPDRSFLSRSKNNL